MSQIIDANSPEDAQRIIDGIVGEVVREINETTYREPFKNRIVPLLSSVHEDYFNRETGPLGQWPKLAARTVRKKGFDTILIEYNNMRSSLLFDGPDHVEDIEDSYMTWGTSDEKAATHQYGTRRVPQRAFVGVHEETADEIAGIVADHIVSGLKG